MPHVHNRHASWQSTACARPHLSVATCMRAPLRHAALTRAHATAAPAPPSERARRVLSVTRASVMGRGSMLRAAPKPRSVMSRGGRHRLGKASICASCLVLPLRGRAPGVLNVAPAALQGGAVPRRGRGCGQRGGARRRGCRATASRGRGLLQHRRRPPAPAQEHRGGGAARRGKRSRVAPRLWAATCTLRRIGGCWTCEGLRLGKQPATAVAPVQGGPRAMVRPGVAGGGAWRAGCACPPSCGIVVACAHASEGLGERAPGAGSRSTGRGAAAATWVGRGRRAGAGAGGGGPAALD